MVFKKVQTLGKSERVVVRDAGVVEPLVHGQHGGLGDREVRQGSARTQGQAMGILRYADFKWAS
jgi:hypothetical protein